MISTLLLACSRLLMKLAMFRRAQKRWRKPKHAPILIYDRNGADLFHEYIDARYTQVLDVRGETINLPVLFRCLLGFDFLGKNYIDTYIEAVQPSVVLTFTDNNPAFYQLKQRNLNLITVSVQNGWRGLMSDIFGSFMPDQAKPEYIADYVLTLGAAVGREYQAHIAGRVLPVGSFRSNHCPPRGSSGKGSIVFISQYRPPVESRQRPSMGTVDGRLVTWEESRITRHCRKKYTDPRVQG